jgi:hypothetical protein
VRADNNMHRLGALLLVLAVGCGSEDAANDPADAGLEGEVAVLETYDVSQFNADLVDGEPTADIAFYVTEDGPLTWEQLWPDIDRAKLIFSSAGVQLRVSSAIRIAIPEEWQSLDPDESDVPTTPEFLETDLYAHLNELATRLPVRNRAILEAITSHRSDQPSGVTAADTIHVVALEDVPISYYEWTGSEWMSAVAPTGGLSFPPYAHADRIPAKIRGVITLSTTPSRFFPDSRVLSHELGHKLINV